MSLSLRQFLSPARSAYARNKPSAATAALSSSASVASAVRTSVPLARPRRSALYVPGSNERALLKAASLPADCLILDCEDAVAPAAKSLARSQICEALRSRRYGAREVVVRINHLSSPWGKEDALAVFDAGADAVALPKVQSAEEVETLVHLLGGAASCPPIWCMVETPLGVLRAESFAARAEVHCLVMGTSDLAADLRADNGGLREALLTSLSMCVLAARAHDKACLDGVHLDLKDDAGFEQACLQGRGLGFDGKTLIHPSTIAAANRVFAPTDKELVHARRIVDAFSAAAADGGALVVLDGKLVEELHARAAKRVLELADNIEALQRVQVYS